MIDQPVVVSYSKDFELSRAFKPSDAALPSGVKAGPSENLMQDKNQHLRHSPTFKSLVYALGPKTVLVRV